MPSIYPTLNILINSSSLLFNELIGKFFTFMEKVKINAMPTTSFEQGCLPAGASTYLVIKKLNFNFILRTRFNGSDRGWMSWFVWCEVLLLSSYFFIFWFKFVFFALGWGYRILLWIVARLTPVVVVSVVVTGIVCVHNLRYSSTKGTAAQWYAGFWR